MNSSDRLVPCHGGYRSLKSFQIAQLVYDVTGRFCDLYIDLRSRTHDQMVQAARSGVQNIAEGSQASGTSKKFEIKLTNVARASLEELRLDYEDFLRHRNLAIWSPDDPRRTAFIASRPKTVDDIAQWTRHLHNSPSPSIHSIPSTPSISSSPPPPTYPELAANAALTLITVACSLLDRQLAAQAAAFESQGGFTERLYHHRKRRRQ